MATLPAYAIAPGRGQIHSTGATPTGKDINSDFWGLVIQSYPAFTMKSSGLFPLMVFLALGILAPWTVEGGKNGELELLWPNTAWSIRGGGS